jgi:hypothetical protein
MANMLIPKWFEEEYGIDKACFGRYMEINQGEYKLLLYEVHPKTKEECENTQSKKHKREEQEGRRTRRNIVSKAA